MSLKLTSDRILVSPIVEDKSRGGILFPESVKSEFNSGPKLYLVIGVGPGRPLRNGSRAPMVCSPGDRVLAHSYTEGAVPLEDGQKIIRQDQVLLVMPRE